MELIQSILTPAVVGFLVEVGKILLFAGVTYFVLFLLSCIAIFFNIVYKVFGPIMKDIIERMQSRCDQSWHYEVEFWSYNGQYN